MEQLLLKEEEIDKIRLDWYGESATDTTRLYSDLIAMSAKAQLKKAVEWLREDCTEHEHTVMMLGKIESFDAIRDDCEECWQALLKEVE